MSEGLVPQPKMNESRYERPNKPWVCGHACEGCPCRIGPGPDGSCRATTECQPVLSVKAGETKGTWTCTRPKDWGGLCVSGPLPDGTCCKVIPKCLPVRSLRARRGMVVRAFVIACAGILLLGLASANRERFINPAPLSSHHSGPEFTRLAAKADGSQGCVLCHKGLHSGFVEIGADAIGAAKASLSFDKLVGSHPKDFSRMDRSCVACHAAQSLHQASVARDTSCSVCHLEHQGAGALPPVTEQRCTACHGDLNQMSASAALARTLPAALFAKKIIPGLVVPATTRPAEGFTKIITSFAVDHPEFQVLRDQRTDPNPLKFNHRLHLAGDRIPPVGGKSLDCADCHKPDVSGAFMQRISFEQNCRACHALNFDEHNPGMTLPHGDATFVRAYLRSLPAQYADHATRNLGITGERERATFVATQMRDLRARVRNGEDLEREVFFSDANTGPAPSIAGLPPTARAKFAGCAYCHTVTPREDAAPFIAPPVTPDRWLLHAQFDHSTHTMMSCVDCHAAAKSERTADIILPSAQTCIKCHSPKGGVSSSCTVCHNYHNLPPATLVHAKPALLLP
jgi:hypothetical protein